MAEMGIERPVGRSAGLPASRAEPPPVHPPPVDEPRVISDVWSRSSGKYRVRAIVLLVVNILLFGGLGCFAFWLRTGYYFAPGIDSYWGVFWHTCQPGGETLTRLLTFPISWEAVPLQIVIHGLLLSALVSIPILVSILYRFPCCLPFVAVVAFVALMPWLGLTLLGSCMLASVKPLRFSFRYASALLGLTLVVVYILVVLRQAWPSPELLSNPGDRVKLVAPWILAIVASCVLMALGLGLAKLVNYRPGAIAPLLAMMFAIPVLLFEAYVGRDELHYRLLEHYYGPASTYFREQHGSDDPGESVDQSGFGETTARERDSVAGLEEIRWQLELEDTQDRRNLFSRHQQQACRDCDWFLKQFPDSRYAPAVLYLKGRSLDMRVDLAAFRDEKTLVFYDTYSSMGSADIWRRLLANAPAESPLCAEALLRLAMLTAREGHVDESVNLLQRLVDDFQGRAPTTQTHAAPGIKGMLRKAPPESSLQLPLDRLVFEGQRWLGILRDNRDPLYGDEPLCGARGAAAFPRLGWLLFDPRSEYYLDNLRSLLARYPRCRLSDNIEVEIAQLTKSEPERAAALEACIARHPPSDALPEALFWLGRTYLNLDKPDKARVALTRIESEFPTSIWFKRAELLQAPLRPAGPRES